MMSNAIDRMRKKKRKRRKVKEGKRSSASSASAEGSPDFRSREDPQKSLSSYSCPPRITPPDSKSDKNFDSDLSLEVNESLRWPANRVLEVSNRSRPMMDFGKFPEEGKTEEEEQERIAIYKMNRRKRYLAAQQALLDKYPDSSIYALSSSSSATNNTDELLSSSSNCAITNSTSPNYSNSQTNNRDIQPILSIRSQNTHLGGNNFPSPAHIQLTHIPHVSPKSSFLHTEISSNQIDPGLKLTAHKIPVPNGV